MHQAGGPQAWRISIEPIPVLTIKTFDKASFWKYVRVYMLLVNRLRVEQQVRRRIQHTVYIYLVVLTPFVLRT